MEKDRGKKRADIINMVDKSKNMKVRIKLSDDRKCWERWVSTNGTEWQLDRQLGSLEEVLKSQQELIDNNYKNLFNLITN